MTAVPIPIEEAVAVLARVAASAPPQTDEGALHLRIVRALDLFSAHGLPLAPERIVPRVAASFDDPAQSLLDLMVTLLRESDRTAAAVMARARAIIAETTSVSDEAARAHAMRRVVVDPAETIGRYLPRDAVLQNDFRRAELVRAWASLIGAPIESGGALEPDDKTARALSRLDYRKIRQDEERLAIERTVIAQHAEAIREKQRREAEALASAQRE